MKDWLVRWTLGGIVREIAENKRGKGLHDLYWWLSGKKSITSAILGLAFSAFVSLYPQTAIDWAPTATFVLGIMVTVGIADREWKSAPPPEDWKRYASKILSAGPAIAAGLAFLANLLQTFPGCGGCAEYVKYVEWTAATFASLCAWIASRWNMPPAFPARRVEDLVAVQ